MQKCKNTTVQPNSTSDEDIVIWSNIFATQDVKVQVNTTGNIVERDGKIQGQTVTLIASRGRIGNSTLVPLLIEAQSMIQANNDPRIPSDMSMPGKAETAGLASH